MNTNPPPSTTALLLGATPDGSLPEHLFPFLLGDLRLDATNRLDSRQKAAFFRAVLASLNLQGLSFTTLEVVLDLNGTKCSLSFVNTAFADFVLGNLTLSTFRLASDSRQVVSQRICLRSDRQLVMIESSCSPVANFKWVIDTERPTDVQVRVVDDAELVRMFESSLNLLEDLLKYFCSVLAQQVQHQERQLQITTATYQRMSDICFRAGVPPAGPKDFFF